MDRLDRQNFDEPHPQRLALARPAADDAHRVGPAAFRLDALRQRQGEPWRCGRSCRPWTGPTSFCGWPAAPKSLADAGENQPLLVAQNYGAGRVLAFAGDTTWHWWMHGFEAAHKRFWRQIILWLARKDQTQEGNVWVRLDKRRFAPGERVDFTAGASRPAAIRSRTPTTRPKSCCPTAAHPLGSCSTRESRWPAPSGRPRRPAITRSR